MEDTLLTFFKEINLDEQYYEDFKDAYIIKAEYIETKKILVVYLELDEVLPVKTYEVIEQMLQENNNNIRIRYYVKQAVYFSELIYEYYNHFIAKYFNKEIAGYLKKVNLDYNDLDLTIEFANEGMELMYQPYKSKIENLMYLAGFNIEYTYKVNSEHELNETIDQIIENEDIKTAQRNNDNIVRKEKPIIQNQKQSRTVYKKSITDLTKHETMDIIDLYDTYLDVCIEGQIFATDLVKLKNGKHIQTIKIYDFTDSIMMKRFEGSGLTIDDMKSISNGMWIKALGDVKYDEFAKEHVLFLKSIQVIKPKIEEKYDMSVEKRVELHAHTNMSTMDGISNPKQYIKQALQYGHTAIAITDHNNVQAFPDAYNAALGSGIKIIYGLESNLIDDEIKIVINDYNVSLSDATYVFFDFETTGLSSESDEIIEIGAVKYKDGIEIDRFQSFVKPNKKVPLYIKELTQINDQHLEHAPLLAEILPDFISFYEDTIMVAHNASFDVAFLKSALSNTELGKFNNCVIDTLQLSRTLDKNRRAHNLGACARAYGVSYNNDVAHRADYDAMVLGQVFEAMKHELITVHNLDNINQINTLCDQSFLIRQRPYHCTILAKNQAGLKDLFKLVSFAHTKYFYDEPRLFKSTINEYREHLLIGSGCINGEVYQQAKSLDKDEFIEMMSFYDYIEVYPPNNLIHLVDLKEYETLDDVKKMTKYIIECAQLANKPVVASGDSHYVLEEQKEFREVYISALGIGGKIHPLFDRKGRIKNIPNQHYRTTVEMLECFNFLDDELAKEIVIKNTNMIADMIEEVKPIKDKLYTPRIDGVDDKLTKMCYDNAHAQYGNPLPEIVEKRLEKELNSIIKHGFSVVYYISSQLVEKSLNDGYLVGSRGSVGSSLVATMTNITEVNPLAPHYYCPSCTYSEFFEDGSVASGYDLEDKKCPKCGAQMKGDGQDIPFETFLGFEGDKVPDIDLNFSGEYQPIAHDYTKELFGEDYVYRAGTIGTVQNKTAFGYAKGYYERKYVPHQIRNTEYERLSIGCEGVKRTTGQHPGGIIVIPDYMDVYDFTPVNFPADDLNSSWKTTHFDFHAIHDNVLKLDILGHVDPTAIRMLQDLTGVDPKTIPTNDKKVLSLFSSNDAIGISDMVSYKNAAIGIPEFGTQFVRGMLNETNPSSFAELVQISGLSHGTDVWLNNAQSLIKKEICTLSEVIGCRDDIMVYLMYRGLEPKLAFTIMESVRKGKGLKDEWIEEMRKNNVPDWYIDSCLKIKYMFPKAHAVAYVLMAIRVAWFKVYYPLEYYATYFTTRCDQFDLEVMIKGVDAMQQMISEINAKGFEASAREKALITVFEVAIEMNLRGISMAPINIDKSLAKKFSVDYDNNQVIPSFIAVEGLGDSVAESVIVARNDKEFLSKEDLESRTGLGQKHIMYLDKIGSLSHLQDLNQLSLF